ncbi:MAG: hypothetical protein NTZ67_03080 [Gammaproteobacteria bacterium]|nr:hypothetical protein [Gammaproteobacteria bacterium]
MMDYRAINTAGGFIRKLAVKKQDCRENCALKAIEYKVAIEKYHHHSVYRRLEILTSVIVIALQIFSIIMLSFQHHPTNFIEIIMAVLAAYVATDFINGLVHMIIDNSTNYTSIIGPFVAAFHLHHAKLMYKNDNPLMVYFYESGHKFWLVLYLLAIFTLQCFFNLNFSVNLFLVTTGLLSSVAELSHFWCHNITQCNAIIRFLQKYHILLSMKHHRFHHCNDNTHYAFLNGMTDGVLNVVADVFYKGYKNRSDQHVMLFHSNQK